MNQLRTVELKLGSPSSGPVLYWMSRDQRVHDNWALIHSIQLAKDSHLEVVFALKPHVLTNRIASFLLTGLSEVHSELRRLNIPFHFIWGDPADVVPKLAEQIKASTVVCDQSPLKNHKSWVENISKKLKCNFVQVDAHNIVPVWFASSKQEWAAYTFRPKINRLIKDWLTDFPSISTQKFSGKFPEFVKFTAHPQSGKKHAQKILNDFLENISRYNSRNNPTSNAQSNLSPYIHFGQISAQKIALEVSKLNNSSAQAEYLEELVVRRELADNYCWYNSNYDSIAGFPNWAQKTLKLHQKDKRDFIYSLNEFENSNTHDPLWNAAQSEMVITGKMHGYMRMYWAKKILEWSPDVQTAQKIAIYLNDKYEYDGRDPNGYTGIAWSIGGVHDRPWFDRPVIGLIRPMTATGLAKKYDIHAYIAKVKSLTAETKNLKS